jgi:hypothetical protein
MVPLWSLSETLTDLWSELTIYEFVLVDGPTLVLVQDSDWSVEWTHHLRTRPCWWSDSCPCPRLWLISAVNSPSTNSSLMMVPLLSLSKTLTDQCGELTIYELVLDDGPTLVPVLDSDWSVEWTSELTIYELVLGYGPTLVLVRDSNWSVEWTSELTTYELVLGDGPTLVLVQDSDCSVEWTHHLWTRPWWWSHSCPCPRLWLICGVNSPSTNSSLVMVPLLSLSKALKSSIARCLKSNFKHISLNVRVKAIISLNYYHWYLFLFTRT